MRAKVPLALSAAALLAWAVCLPAQKGDKPKADERPPHGQDQLPGPPLSPADALKKMKVPDGFAVELVLSEPDLVNPVAMTFDDRGRIWVTESLEYPRRSAGPGKDRIKVFESTKGDGKYDKMTVFAEGLNIPSGIAVGYGGVWVANAPDILFYKEGPDGTAAGKPEVIVTGFGRDDTHELPNSLTWGPDGWLYGLNGVFNRSVVKQGDKTFDFTCALFRIHPRTHEFQIFCEGTSNPWGVAVDDHGSFFVSACVIDHLWHLVETGYYHRQGGPYPPFTWKIDSIVKHKHQKAAYCGIVWFDSLAYPEEYRGKLFMGNIHGNCINSDELTRDGSTYFAKPRPDFLTANDAWFMPVSQKVGPDGCLYILDWYDRYHCYQDANRDPAGIDRERGRLYCIRYKNSPRAGKFDFAKLTDDQLGALLASPNVFDRERAQRLLTERGSTPAVRENMQKSVLTLRGANPQRLHLFWVLIAGGPLDRTFHEQMLADRDPTFRAWAVRAASNAGKADAAVCAKIARLAQDPSPDVQLQVAIAARKVEGLDAMEVLLDVLTHCGDDKLIPHIVWQNLHPLLDGQGERFVKLVEQMEPDRAKALAPLMPRVVERVLGGRKIDPAVTEALFRLLTVGPRADPVAARALMALLAGKVQSGEIKGDSLASLSERLLPRVRGVIDGKGEAQYFPDDYVLAATLRDPGTVKEVEKQFASARESEAVRLKMLEALVYLKSSAALETAGRVLTDPKGASPAFRGQVLAALGRLDDPQTADVVLAAFPNLAPAHQAAAVDLLSQRPDWGKKLLQAVADKKLPASALGANQVRKLLAGKDKDIARLVKEHWGTLREERNPEREKVVKEMRDFLVKTRGDPIAGSKVFANVCGKCHKIHGEGQDVGPDITANGRATFDQLLSNVFDPSLVIGAAYQATTVTTTKGRTLTGLLVEDGKARVVLKVEGGKTEAIPRDQIDEMHVSRVSLMPEGLERQLKPQELADLFAFLCLDRPPGDPSARKIPGAP
jgi:putative membrane-bound dehydrogenase-like protein